MKKIALILFIPVICFGQVNVKDYGARGDGIADDTQAFQRAFNAAISSKNKLIIPPPPDFYKLTNTINVLPQTGNQVWIDVESWGWGGNGTNTIRYMGASNKPVFKIVGLKSGVWTGLRIGINEGLTNVQIFDIDTTPSMGSTSFVTFKAFYLNLGDQPNNVGVRMGHISAGGGDISNYQFENCTVFGARLPGQIAYQVEGTNTLSNTWVGGFVAFCDKIYSNKSGPGATSDRGNGSVFFFGLGGSNNNTDFDINWEQCYLISGGRFEAGKRFLNTVDQRFRASITIQNCQINDYEPTDGVLMYVGTAASLVVDNCNMNRKGGDFNRMIVLGGTGARGTLMVRGGGASSPKPFYKKLGTGTQWKIYVEGVGKFSPPNGVYTTDVFDDERPAFKAN